MKIPATVMVLLFLFAPIASADEVSDALAKAQKLYDAKKYGEAKAELEKALAVVAAKAKAQIPPPTVKDRTYINTEHAFRVTRPEKDWEFKVNKPAEVSADGTIYFGDLWLTTEGMAGDDLVLFYAQDLKVRLGPGRFAALKGHEVESMKAIGQKATGSIKQIEEPKVAGQTELTVGGFAAVRTDYTAHKGDKAMKCFTLVVLRDNMLFTAVFVGAVDHEKIVEPAFKQVLESIDLSPVPPPAK